MGTEAGRSMHRCLKHPTIARSHLQIIFQRVNHKGHVRPQAPQRQLGGLALPGPPAGGHHLMRVRTHRVCCELIKDRPPPFAPKPPFPALAHLRRPHLPQPRLHVAYFEEKAKNDLVARHDVVREDELQGPGCVKGDAEALQCFCRRVIPGHIGAQMVFVSDVGERRKDASDRQQTTHSCGCSCCAARPFARSCCSLSCSRVKTETPTRSKPSRRSMPICDATCCSADLTSVEGGERARLGARCHVALAAWPVALRGCFLHRLPNSVFRVGGSDRMWIELCRNAPNSSPRPRSR